ncbi:chondroitinase-B domain-containing protein [Pseudarthrobacter sp. N5]|uniref:chondroitinase-B domain-containing protein n=1 Tax=Pseudarthrobacter sp. N5 TaxID=3418416 RepID=UPI003CEDF7F0
MYLGIEGAGTTEMAQRVHVYRNYFSDQSFSGANAGEPIRLGVSPRALSSAHAVVEFNLFERANGDPEAISVKSSDNTIRYNTIRNSLAELCCAMATEIGSMVITFSMGQTVSVFTAMTMRWWTTM